MSFDARQRKALTQLLKALALDFGFTENALTSEIGDIIGQSQDVSGAGSSADTSAGAGNAGKVLLLDAAGKADGVDLSQPTASAGTGASGGTAPAFTGTPFVCSDSFDAVLPTPETTFGGATLVSDVSISAVALTIANQPAVPCKLNIIKTDAAAGYSATVTIVGVGPGGEAIASEVISLLAVDGSHTYVTANAYAKITSITVSALAGNIAASHIAVGQASAIGLPVPSGAASFVVYKEAVGATPASVPVNENVGTVDAPARTVIPTTLGNGTKSLRFWFTYQQTPAGAVASHTHTGPAHTHALN